MRVVAPVGRQGLAIDQLVQRAGHRLDRRERPVDLVANDAHEALPGLPLFLAQRAAQVRDHEQLVRPAAVAKAAPANLPTPRTAGKRVRGDSARGSVEQAFEAELASGAALELFGGRSEQRRRRAIHEPQPQPRIEREHRNVDFGADLVQQCAGLQCFER